MNPPPDTDGTGGLASLPIYYHPPIHWERIGDPNGDNRTDWWIDILPCYSD